MKARTLAISILSRVRATDAYLNVTLDAQLDEHASLSSRDAAFVTELCYGVTRRELTLDNALSTVSDRKLEKLEDRVLCALRMGVYQMFYTRVPRRAAVAETVEALKELGLERAAGFVNAILRKLSMLEALPLPPADKGVAHLSVRESHPGWLVSRWLHRFGPERTEAMLVADNQPARVVVRANHPVIERNALLKQLQGAGLSAEATHVSSRGIVFSDSGRVEDLLGFEEGLWQVQDEAAQLVVLYADVPAGGRIWDVCAAPGGKACQLAESASWVLATDLHAHKLRRIAAEAKRLRLDARLRAWAHDATQPLPEGEGDFDAVLLDAPCSGLGTLRRHPELRYRRQESDLAHLAALQAQLLGACQSRVREGGLLIYAVCSTEPEEGIDQIKRFLTQHPAFVLEPSGGFEADSVLPLVDGCLRTLPGPEGWDGFFAARLRRRVP